MNPQALAAQLRQPTGEYGTIVGQQMNIGNALLNTRVNALLKLKRNEHLLEIGMGNGHFVANILRKHRQVTYTGIDYSNLMVKAARANNLSFVKNARATFITGNANALPLNDCTMDKAIAINTLYFWEDPALDISELFRVLKPGGTLYIGIRPRSVMEKLPFTKFGFKLYEQPEVANLLITAGFENVVGIDLPEPAMLLNNVGIAMRSVIVSGQKPA